jgi:chemotaxis protein CheD
MALITVGAAQCKVSSDPRDVLLTHALGSCIAVVLYDPVAKVAGILHFMLPNSIIDIAAAARRPSMYGDTGLALLLDSAAKLGASTSRILLMAAGGASMLEQNEAFNIGHRNCVALAGILEQTRIFLQEQHLGGSKSRTLRVDVARGRVRIKGIGRNEKDIVTCLGQIESNNIAGIGTSSKLRR